MINYRKYVAILRAVRAGRMPPQNTPLGGSIRIHGGGSSRDWTLGCIALDDKDVKDLYARVKKGTRVEVYNSAASDRRLNAPGLLNRLVLAGARAQLAARAFYSSKATAEYRLKFPMGDIKPFVDLGYGMITVTSTDLADGIPDSDLEKFQAVVDSLPDKDARPRSEPRAPNPWDRKPGKKKKSGRSRPAH